MKNIKFYKDGNRMIIVLENAGETEEQLLTKMLGAVLLEKDIKDLNNVNIPNENPVVEEKSNEQVEKEEVFTFGKYKGKTCSEVVKEAGRFKAFMFFKTLSSIYNKKLKEDVSKKIAEYDEAILKPLLDKVELASYDDMITFFKNFNPLFEKELAEEVNSMQYTSIDELLSYEDDDTKHSLYKKYIEKIM